MLFKQAKNFHAGRTRAVRLVVIHDMEYPERENAAEWCAGYFSAGNSPMASAHYYIDNNTIIQGVREAHTAFAAPGANADGIQLEHAGYASQTREKWLDAYSTSMLRNMSAPLVAGICARHNIPIRHLTNSQLRAGYAGIIAHSQASQVYRLSDHHDVGKNFPWSEYLSWIKAANGGTPMPPITTAPPPTGVVIRGPFPLARGHWYGPNDGTIRSHSGARAADRYNVSRIQSIAGTRADGYYGGATKAAVKNWQRKAKIAVDGLVGPKTWGAM